MELESLIINSDDKEDCLLVQPTTKGKESVLYPVADVSLEVNGQQIAVEAAVSDTLPFWVQMSQSG